MKIILLGYMASGKSTVGGLLAKIIDYDFIDLDDYIEGKEGKSVSGIFKEDGEVYFRKVEHIYLKELLSAREKTVISLGGGTPCYANNMDLIKSDKNAISFYLKSSIDEIVNRLMNQKNQRPIVADIKSREALKEFVGKHLFERNPYYLRSDHVLETDEKTIQSIVEEIIFKLV